MSEITDLIMPILQRIQTDLAEVKRVQAEHSQRFEDMEIYLAYATGIETQNKQGPAQRQGKYQEHKAAPEYNGDHALILGVRPSKSNACRSEKTPTIALVPEQ